jgi:Dolichyl-phosphate-mannose-protein mannosyltransferase
MAMHQSYALNYWPGGYTQASPWHWSGNYPPFVHLVIALCYLVLHPGPHVAVLANFPATLLLLWGVYELASELAGREAARWACFLTALTPYLMWMSRETILDYWLSAWVVASLVALTRTRGFQERLPSLVLGLALALGLLTKWLFVGFLVFPMIYVFMQERVWRYPARLINAADALIVAGTLAGVWYLPNLPKLVSYFAENAAIGAREGEPPVFSFQSLIYYIRLLEGYQLFAPLFLLLLISSILVWRKGLLHDAKFLVIAIAGGWLAMTLLRTKDPRFTMPLLGLLAIFPAAWLASWGRAWISRTARIALVALLFFQAYLINFGVSWLPAEVIIMPGYQGSLRWDWNLYIQHYFHILGAPLKEDWKQAEIISALANDSARSGLRRTLAVVPDLPRFNAANFHLYSRLLRTPVRVDHPQTDAGGIGSFDGFDYVIITEGDQGMSWTTLASPALNQIVVDAPQVFRLVEIFPLPGGDSARLYSVNRGEAGRSDD